jgi:hypothetical protein
VAELGMGTAYTMGKAWPDEFEEFGENVENNLEK